MFEKNDMLEKVDNIVSEFIKPFNPQNTTDKAYASMKYPKLLPLMRFNTGRWQLEGFGSVMAMKTRTMGDMMTLETISFTPNSGKAVPFLLIDIMSMKKMRVVFIEFYDCTGKKLYSPELAALADKYKGIPDYNETGAWYIHERMAGSLIKSDKAGKQPLLLNMIKEALDIYKNMINNADTDPACIEGLKAFRERMIKEGNPSSVTMTKVLGAEGSANFFRDYVMTI